MENYVEPENFTEEEVDILDAMIDDEQDDEKEHDYTDDVNQRGGALPIEDLFDIQQIQQRFVRKFNTHGTDYTITMRPDVPRGDIMQFMSLDEKMDLLKFTNEQRCSKHDSKSEANVVKTIFAHVRK